MVIGIVAVLATLAFPALASAKSRAQRVHCAGNLRQIALAARLYAEDHDDRLPIAPPADGPAGSAASRATSLPDLLRDQLKDPASFQCRRDTRPEETRRARGSYEGNPAHANRSLRRLAAERSAATNAPEPWWYRDLQPWHQGRNTVRADGSVRLEP